MDVEKLRRWFLLHKRDLPWRCHPTPYAVWISEVMLQQTQVQTVLEYYPRWMEKFPTLENLAKASLEEVIKAWEGLGYYSRARRLHQAAQEMVAQYGGQFPSEALQLRKIPGLGPYTVNALLSFAFHQKAAAVDGNVARVIARYLGSSLDISQAKTQAAFRSYVDDVLPEKEPWVVMEALIELGALICKKQPKCPLCPLRLQCKAYQEGKQELYPIKKKLPEPVKLYHLVGVIEHKGEFLLYQEKDKNKRMADLWSFPLVEADGIKETFSHEVLGYFQRLPKKVAILQTLYQTFTRYRVTLIPFYLKAVDKPSIKGYTWIKKTDLSLYPFSSGHKRLVHLLSQDLPYFE
ncbi:MAG: A/G-specific adenine glycosylase [Chlamydiae bacterium]|nr:A/G-specific adenine glycosylase [Chlamydiota bacterium]